MCVYRLNEGGYSINPL